MGLDGFFLVFPIQKELCLDVAGKSDTKNLPKPPPPGQEPNEPHDFRTLFVWALDLGRF